MTQSWATSAAYMHRAVAHSALRSIIRVQNRLALGHLLVSSQESRIYIDLTAVHRICRRMRTCSMACMRAEGAMRSSSGRPKGYAAASITYSITPHDHTSATCICVDSGRLPCLASMESPHGSSLACLRRDLLQTLGGGAAPCKGLQEFYRLEQASSSHDLGSCRQCTGCATREEVGTLAL